MKGPHELLCSRLGKPSYQHHDGDRRRDDQQKRDHADHNARNRKANAASTAVVATTATAPMTHARHPVMTIALPPRSIAIPRILPLREMRPQMR
jgi:hypothetical protein